MEDFNRFIRPCWRVDGFDLLEFVIFAPGKTSSWLRTPPGILKEGLGVRRTPCRL